MKRLRYDYTAIQQIFTPLTIDHEDISLSHDLTETLTTLFPRKAPIFPQKDLQQLAISLLPEAPFGPDTSILIDFLFHDFSEALLKSKEFFGLNSIEIICADDRFAQSEILWSKAIRKRHEQGIFFNVFEFYKLYTAAIQRQRVQSLFVSIFLDSTKAFCLYVPEGICLKDIFSKVPEILAYLQQHPNSKLVHPLLKKEIDPDTETTSESTSLIMPIYSGYTVAPDDTFWFRFPYFNQKIGIRKGKIVKESPLPCSNCLACSAYCPAELFPSVLYHHIFHGNTDETEALNIQRCIQCGKCSFVCPAYLPLYETITQTLHKLREEKHGNTAENFS